MIAEHLEPEHFRYAVLGLHGIGDLVGIIGFGKIIWKRNKEGINVARQYADGTISEIEAKDKIGNVWKNSYRSAYRVLLHQYAPFQAAALFLVADKYIF